MSPWTEPARQKRFADLWRRAVFAWSRRDTPNRHGLRRHRGAFMAGKLAYGCAKALGVDQYTGLHVMMPLIQSGAGPSEALSTIVDKLAPVHGPLRWHTADEQALRIDEQLRAAEALRA